VPSRSGRTTPAPQDGLETAADIVNACRTGAAQLRPPAPVRRSRDHHLAAGRTRHACRGPRGCHHGRLPGFLLPIPAPWRGSPATGSGRDAVRDVVWKIGADRPCQMG
jgi:hypothetical protein